MGRASAHSGALSRRAQRWQPAAPTSARAEIGLYTRVLQRMMAQPHTKPRARRSQHRPARTHLRNRGLECTPGPLGTCSAPRCRRFSCVLSSIARHWRPPGRRVDAAIDLLRASSVGMQISSRLYIFTDTTDERVLTGAWHGGVKLTIFGFEKWVRRLACAKCVSGVGIPNTSQLVIRPECSAKYNSGIFGPENANAVSSTIFENSCH